MDKLTTETLLDYCDSDDSALQTEALIKLVDDAPDLEKVLRAIANRFPFTGNQPEKILAVAH